MLTFEGVSLRYGRRLALDALSLSVEPGEVVALLGPNGAGKTTAVALASGTLRPDAGNIRVNKRDPAHHHARQSLGLAPQQLGLYNNLTAREHLRFFARLYGVTHPNIVPQLERFHLDHRADERVGNWSEGMQRRLQLAIATIHRPPLLILDEPTAGVDPHARRHVLEHVRTLRDEGAAVLFTTHLIDEAESLADRVAILNHGRLIAFANVQTLLGAHHEQHQPTKHHHHQHPAHPPAKSRTLESLFIELTASGREP